MHQASTVSRPGQGRNARPQAGAVPQRSPACEGSAWQRSRAWPVGVRKISMALVIELSLVVTRIEQANWGKGVGMGMGGRRRVCFAAGSCRGGASADSPGAGATSPGGGRSRRACCRLCRSHSRLHLAGMAPGCAGAALCRSTLHARTGPHTALGPGPPSPRRRCVAPQAPRQSRHPLQGPPCRQTTHAHGAVAPWHTAVVAPPQKDRRHICRRCRSGRHEDRECSGAGQLRGSAGSTRRWLPQGRGSAAERPARPGWPHAGATHLAHSVQSWTWPSPGATAPVTPPDTSCQRQSGCSTRGGLWQSEAPKQRVVQLYSDEQHALP